MDQTQIEEFKALLNGHLDRLVNQADLVKSEMASQDGQAIEYVDRASATADQDMKLRIRSREDRLIKKVRLALERIATGRYGLCEQCEEPISLKRLHARPVTTKCIECKEMEEVMEAELQ